MLHVKKQKQNPNNRPVQRLKIANHMKHESYSESRHTYTQKTHPTVKHKGIQLRKCSNIYRFMQMRLHMRSVHLLTCTCLGLQTDLLHTHERRGGGGLGWGRGDGGLGLRWGGLVVVGAAAHCSALSARRSLAMPAAASLLQLQ